MPSFLHEALVDLFRNDLELAPRLIREALHIPLPGHDPTVVAEADLTQIVPTEYRADLVLQLGGDEPRTVVVEVQLRKNERKHYSWPLYVVASHARWRRPATLLVVTPSASVADWARRPIDFGQPLSPFTPLVVGPEQMPRIDDPDVALRLPEAATLSAVAHGNSVGGAEVVLAAVRSIGRLDRERAALYYDLVLTALNKAGRRALEDLMETRRYEYQSDFARKYFQQGETKAKAEALLLILTTRQLEPTDAQRAAIAACSDGDRLDSWMRRALTAASVGDVFSPDD